MLLYSTFLNHYRVSCECAHSLVFDPLFHWATSMCSLHIIALCVDAIGPQPLIMICAVWPAAECELSAAGNFRWWGRVNVRDNTVADRQAVWSLWLLALLIETDALLSWGTLWQMEAEIHRRLDNTQGGSVLSGHQFSMFSPCRCDFPLATAWWPISKWLRYFEVMGHQTIWNEK